MLNSMVRSRLTYSCQTWSLTQRQKERIDTSDTFMLIQIIKGGFRRKKSNTKLEFSYVLTNAHIHKMCEIEEVGKYVNQQQVKYLAHLARQPNSTMNKKLLFNDDKTTKRGKTIITLEQQVIDSLQTTADQFYKKALNREH